MLLTGTYQEYKKDQIVIIPEGIGIIKLFKIYNTLETVEVFITVINNKGIPIKSSLIPLKDIKPITKQVIHIAY